MKTTTPGMKYATTKALAKFWLPHLIATEDLFTHLEYVDKTSKEMRVDALRAELKAFDDMLSADVPPSWRFKEYRSRSIITLVGKITYMRRIYQEPTGVSHAYLDEILGIRTRFKLAPDAFLWIVKVAADISYRKTARAFFERTGAKISHWLVMAALHEEGALILEDVWQKALGKCDRSSDDMPLTTETLFVEFDGIHIPLQKDTHERKGLRWVYEMNRKKNSFELKVGCAYAVKDDKKRRLGITHFAFDESASDFWRLTNAKLASSYDIKYVDEVHLSSDAAGWCKSADLEVFAGANSATHHLDRFHLNREIRRAFGGRTKAAQHFIGLAYRKKTKKMLSVLDRLITNVKVKDKYLDLKSYLISNRQLIENGSGPSMGTQEGTNAHVFAAKMKAWGGAWSRRGAAFMAAIRARITSGEKLIAPVCDNAMYDDYQIAKRKNFEELCLTKNYSVAQNTGKGYEPKRGKIVLSTHMTPHLYGVLNYS